MCQDAGLPSGLPRELHLAEQLALAVLRDIVQHAQEIVVPHTRELELAGQHAPVPGADTDPRHLRVPRGRLAGCECILASICGCVKVSE